MLLLSNYVIPITGLLVAILSLIVFCYVVIKARNFAVALLNTINEGLIQIFSASSENQLSTFAEILHLHATDIGQEVGQAFQRGITGSMGGSIRKANAEITAEMVKTNPKLAQQMAFNNMLPKSMTKNSNPLVNMFMNMLFNNAMNITGGSSDKDNHTHSVNNPDAGMWG